MEIEPFISEILISFVVIGSLILMTMIFSILIAQMMYSLFDN